MGMPTGDLFLCKQKKEQVKQKRDKINETDIWSI
jgi:hypothetical protein